MATRLRRNRLFLSGFVLLLIGVLAAGCNTSLETSAQETAKATGAVSSTRAADAERPTVTVEIRNFAFSPASLAVPPGAQIIFVNHDPTPHNVVQGTAREVAQAGHKPLFASPELGKANTWEIVLDEPGEYAFACTIAGHYLMGMEGVIQVAEGAEVSSPAQTAAESADAAAVHAGASNDTAGGHGGHSTGASHGNALPDAPDLPEGVKATPEGLVELEPFRVEGNVKEFAIDIQEVRHELLTASQ